MIMIIILQTANNNVSLETGDFYYMSKDANA